MLELAEAWSDHAFTLETCCLASHEAASHGMADDPEWARGLLRGLGGPVERAGPAVGGADAHV